MQHDIHPLKCVEGGVAHSELKQVTGGEEAGQVVENELSVVISPYSHHREASGLGLGAHDRQVLPDESIQEGGFPGVGGAGEGDVAGPRHEQRKWARKPEATEARRGKSPLCDAFAPRRRTT
jgi:hypothetical protein